MDPNYWNQQYRQLPSLVPPNSFVRGYDSNNVLDQAAALSGISTPAGLPGLHALTPQPIPAHPAARQVFSSGHLPSINYSDHLQFSNQSSSSSQIYKNAGSSFLQDQNKNEASRHHDNPTSAASSLSMFPQFSAPSTPSAYPEPPPAHSNSSRGSQRAAFQAPISTQANLLSEMRTTYHRADHLQQTKLPSQSPHMPQFNDQYNSPRNQTTPSPITSQSHSMSSDPLVPASPYQSLNSLRSFAGTFQENISSPQSSSLNQPPVSTQSHSSVNADGSYGTVSLHDLADISSYREKLQEQHNRSLANGQQQLISQQLQHLAGHNVQNSPSPQTNNSPQVQMEGSPHFSNMASSPLQVQQQQQQQQQHQQQHRSHHHQQHQQQQSHQQQNQQQQQQQSTTPVQAPADSTTKPKKRSRPPKKKKSTSPPPLEKYEAPNLQQQVHVPQAIHAGFPGGSQFEQMMQMSSQNSYQSPCKYENDVPSPTYSSASLASHILHANSVMMDTPIPQFPDTVDEKDSVFMTNTGGNSFFNPQDDGEVEVKYELSFEEGLSLGMGTMSPKRYRTKAEQKQVPVIIDDPEFQAEFGHLDSSANGIDVNSPPDGYQSNPLDSQAPAQSPPQQKQSASSTSAFQNSFLSFLEGKKPETLSSVTNSTVVKRPAIKYIPEPPRPKPPPPPPKKQVDSDDEKMGFSDDDSQSKSQSQITKTVSNVITKLGKDKTPQKSSVLKSSVQTTPSSSAEKQKVPPLKISLAKVVIPSPSKSKRKSGGGSGSKRKRKSNADDFVADDDDVPKRERSTRKAKVVAEEKKKQREALKSKRKQMYSDDDFSDPEDFIALSSDEEKPYDSDQDPAWDPKLDTQPAAAVYIPGDSDDERSQKFKNLGRGRIKSISKARKSTSSRSSSTETKAASSLPSVVVSRPPVIASLVDSSDDEAGPVHGFQRGDFVLEKKELSNLETFPIWRLDAGRLLQKYEAVMVDGRLLHKSLSTYTSWSEAVKRNYRAIRVRQLSIQSNVETVEVLPQFRPQPPDVRLEEDPLIQAFNVYIQIMLSQALEPGFLAAITKENDEYYTKPLHEIEGLIEKRKAEMEPTLGWNPEFKEVVEKFPLLAMYELGASSEPCQATNSNTPSAVKCRLLGPEYNRATLEGATKLDVNMEQFQEFSISAEVNRQLRLYHRLVHYRYNIHRKCITKTLGLKAGGQETSVILDQCLQNRVWVQSRFRSFKRLVLPTPPISTTN